MTVRVYIIILTEDGDSDVDRLSSDVSIAERKVSMTYNKNAKMIGSILKTAEGTAKGSDKFWMLYEELQQLAMSGDQLAEAAMNSLLGVSTSADKEMLSGIR